MKNYLLLRDNQQSGPYTAESLQKMNLKKFDLIWVEGESIMWKYPSEIREFQHFAPQAEITEGTKINSRKEKQMLYFQSCIDEMNFKTTNIQFINQPDALLSDVPAGYEYIVMAQDYKIADNNVKYNNTTEENEVEQALMQVKEMLDKSFDYTVLGASQLIDTPEIAANVSDFTCTIEMPVRYKHKKMTEPETEIVPVQKKKKINPGVAGWLTVVAAAFMHFKL